MLLAHQFQYQKVKRSRSPGPLMLTQIVHHIFQMQQGRRTSNMAYGWRTKTRTSRRRYDLQSQRSRSQSHVISLSRVGPIAYKSKMNSRSITKSFSVKRSKVRITGRLTQTQNVPYLPNGKAQELQSWYADAGRRPASAASAMTSKVKGQGHKLTSSVRLISVSS